MKNWLLASRPKTLLASVSPVILGSAYAFSKQAFYVWPALAALLGAILIQVGTNFANDYFDFKKGADTEERQGPVRATQAGLISETQMKKAFIFIFLLATVVGAYLTYIAGWPIVIIGLLSITSGILYTGGPKPLAYVGLGDLFVLIFFGPIAVAGTYYVQSLRIDFVIVVIGLVAGTVSSAILAVNNLRDIETDRKANKMTLPARFGKVFGQSEYLLFILPATVLPFYLFFYFHLSALVFIAFISFAIIISPIKTVIQFSSPKQLNDVLAKTSLFLFSYSVLLSVGMVI